MIEIGKKQKLTVDRFTENGAYLVAQTGDESVLLPKKYVTEDIKEGTEIEVFIYKDSKDRMIATTKKPLLMVGDIGVLRVVETTGIGAFMDWGLEKDLFLPFKEQKGNISKGQSYLVYVYLDKSKRICATTYVNNKLSNESNYEVNDTVTGTIYGISREYGIFVAVDDKYRGLVPKNEVFDDYSVGDKIEARVVKVKEDGKLDLSTRKKAYKEINTDAQKLLDQLVKHGGKYHLNDSSSPDLIKRELKMSKRAFKRAIGNLLKDKKIIQTKDGIQLINM